MIGHRDFLPYMEQLRALAITLVVAGHVALSMGLPRSQRVEEVIFNLISGGTIIFVFISGFLFHHLNDGQFIFRKYFLKKLKLILFPYLIMGFPVVVFLVLHRDASYGGYFLPEKSGFWGEYVTPVFKYFLTGRFLQAYWFIPFFVLLLLFSSVFILFSALSFRVQVSILILLFSLSLVLHRPIWVMNPFQSLVYYTPVYLLGVFYQKIDMDCLSLWGPRKLSFFLF